jgi:[ribosomal protein S18]-alanine N-acetyltransferase
MTTRANTVIELVRLRPAHVAALVDMLGTVAQQDALHHFSPHGFDVDSVTSLCTHDRKDLYYVLTSDTSVIGYGLLRGWEEGFDTPSLGIAIHPSYRGEGHGRMLMGFLHSAARARGAEQVRLRVHASNDGAMALYRQLGYRFETPADSQGLLVAHLRLKP